MAKFSFLLVAGVLACLSHVLALDYDDFLANPLFKEESSTTQLQRVLLTDAAVAGGSYGGCTVRSMETFLIASNSASSYGYFRDRVLRKALRPVYATYGYRRPQCTFKKTRAYPKHEVRVQIIAICSYPVATCAQRTALQKSVTDVVKHYAVMYKSY